MWRIDEENEKTLRQGMEVFCVCEASGVGSVEVSQIGVVEQSVADYDWPGIINNDSKLVRLKPMHLAGFVADGSFSPISPEDISNGYVPCPIQYNISGTIYLTIKVLSSPFDLNVYALSTNGERYLSRLEGLSGTVGEDIELEIYTNSFHKVVGVDVDPDDVLQESSTFFIDKVTTGHTYVFDNENIVQLDLSLRGLSIAPDEVDLPASELTLQAYTQNNMINPEDLEKLFGRNAKISYSAGYRGDSSQPRTFYITENPSCEKNLLTIKALDAVGALLDVYYKNRGGVRIEGPNPSEEIENCFVTYGNRIVQIFDDVGVPLKYDAIFDTAYGGDYAHIFLSTYRTMISQVHKWTLANINDMTTRRRYVRFRDAGIPELRYYSPYKDDNGMVYGEELDFSDAKDIYLASDLKLDVGKRYDKIEVNVTDCRKRNTTYYTATNQDINDLETASMSNRYIGSAYGVGCRIVSHSLTSVDYIAKAANVQIYGVNYKPTISERKQAFSEDGYFYVGNPKATDGNTLTLSNLPVGTLTAYEHTQDQLETMRDFPRIAYTFTYRGDPRLQPLDHILVHDKNGATIPMTIETIETTHVDGGMSSEITARDGFY